MILRIVLTAGTSLFLFTGCRRASNQPNTIMYYEPYASDYAETYTKRVCSQIGALCDVDARDAESEYADSLVSEFQIRPECHELRLVIMKQPGTNSVEVNKIFGETMSSRWDLTVSYHPAANKQPWNLSRTPNEHDLAANGDDDVSDLLKRVCLSAKMTGGIVTR